MDQAENELLTRVGPGTPMGEFMRRYWHPVALCRDIAEPDSAPMRLRVLGQDFVLFRDTQGKVGLLDEKCPHRQASMAVGRVEDGGIRCLYHGWKVDIDGRLLETPNVTGDHICKTKRMRSYPVVESAGMIWAYLGDPGEQPPFRRLVPTGLPDDQVYTVKYGQHANYLQCLEAGLDSSHVTMLHTNQARPSWTDVRGGSDAVAYRAMDDSAPRLDTKPTDFGMYYSAMRAPGEDGLANMRIVPAFLPNGRIIPGPVNKKYNNGAAENNGTWSLYISETPIDDEHTWTFFCFYNTDKPVDREMCVRLAGLTDPRMWSEERPHLNMDWSNGFLQDRAAMKRANWSGLPGIIPEDAMMVASMGPIVDRTQESLVAADLPVVAIRRRLRDAVEAFGRGEEPSGVRIEDLSSVEAVDIDAPARHHWTDFLQSERRAEPVA